MEQINIKKIEKISQAIYLVSNHLKDNEPIKWELRRESISFIENAKAIVEYDIRGIPKDISIEIFSSCAKDIISMLSLSSNSGLISTTNIDIIINEIESLLSSINKNVLENNIKAGYVLSQDFFATDHTFTDINDKGHRYNTLIHHKSNKVELSNQNSKSNNDSNNSNNIKDKKNDRQTRIVSILKEQSNLTIKDFVKVIEDCSEKTIQRELLSLVEKGIVKKDGERRWSRYSLK